MCCGIVASAVQDEGGGRRLQRFCGCEMRQDRFEYTSKCAEDDRVDMGALLEDRKR